jgi:hypothetical protein
LVIGGYGTFGGRLVDLLADEPRLRLIVAGRSLESATAFCARSSQATLVPAQFDRDGDVLRQLQVLRPDLVVDASGPFQVYGKDPYRLPRAVIESGADYLDLADAADFVVGIETLDALARERGRVALSGVSSFPVLTAAVVRRLAPGLSLIESIEAGIAPSPFAGVGLNVVKAIASYAGRPVSVVEDGDRRKGYASLIAAAMSSTFQAAFHYPPSALASSRCRTSLCWPVIGRARGRSGWAPARLRHCCIVYCGVHPGSCVSGCCPRYRRLHRS